MCFGSTRMNAMNAWLSLVLGVLLGGLVSWSLSHLYYRKAAQDNEQSNNELKAKLDESHAREEELRSTIEHSDQRRRLFDVRSARYARYVNDDSKPIKASISDSDVVTLENVSGKDLQYVSFASMPFTEQTSMRIDKGFLYQDVWHDKGELRFNSPGWLWESDGIGVSWYAGYSYPEFVFIPFDPSKTMFEYRNLD